MIEFSLGRYAVDEAGNIYSLRNHAGNLRKVPMQMKCRLSDEGYMTVSLNINGKKCLRLVHRVVAEAYIPNPDNKPEVNHKNGIKVQNAKSNLEWCSKSENALHAYELGLRTPNRGQLGRTNDKSPLSKPILRISKQGTIMERYPSISEAQRQGYSQGNISAVIAGKRQSHKGWVWAFE